MSDPPDVPRPAASSDGGAFAERHAHPAGRRARRDCRARLRRLSPPESRGSAAGVAPASPADPAPSPRRPHLRRPLRRRSRRRPAGEMVVDVVGAVRVPGVVSLHGGARVLDAIRAAGGVAPGADLERLNLAAKLTDGSRIAVPLLGQPPPAIDPGAVSGSPDPAAAGADRRRRGSARAGEREHCDRNRARGPARDRPDVGRGDRGRTRTQRAVPLRRRSHTRARHRRRTTRAAP